MSHTPRLWKQETRPQDCYDWLTPEDVCRHALAAFYLARQSVTPPPGQRFKQPGEDAAWSDRRTFADSLTEVFAMRVKTDGYHLGVEPEWADDARMLQRWKLPANWQAKGLDHPTASTTPTPGGMGACPHGSEAEAVPARATSPRDLQSSVAATEAATPPSGFAT